MPDSLLEGLMSQLDRGGIDTISREVGVSRDQAMQVAAGALPALLAGLDRNSQDAAGAAALAGALDRDHDGSALDDIVGFLGQSSSAASGSGILRHVFGSRQSSMENTLGQMSGLDSGSVGQILAMLAPLVMGMLGREKRSRGLDLGGLTELLGSERRTAQQRAPQAVDLLGGLLDSDGDGQMMDDVAKIGGDLLGGLFGRKK
jgi:hypothetical protein